MVAGVDVLTIYMSTLMLAWGRRGSEWWTRAGDTDREQGAAASTEKDPKCGIPTVVTQAAFSGSGPAVHVQRDLVSATGVHAVP